MHFLVRYYQKGEYDMDYSKTTNGQVINNKGFDYTLSLIGGKGNCAYYFGC